MRAELRLARPSSEPLAHLALDPDPLQSFARALAAPRPRTRARRRSRSIFCPATAGARRRLRRTLLRQARRANTDRSPTRAAGLLDVLGGRRRAGWASAGGRCCGAASGSASRSPRRCCRTSRCFTCRSSCAAKRPVKGMAAERLQGLLGCFDAWAAANSFRVVGVRLLGLAFARLGSARPARRGLTGGCDTGLFRPARQGVVERPRGRRDS